MSKKIVLIAAVFILGFIIGFSTSNISNHDNKLTITGQTLSQANNYSYTTAICNNENKCLDVLVECLNGEVVSITPTSELIDLGRDFRDFRPEREKFCS